VACDSQVNDLTSGIYLRTSLTRRLNVFDIGRKKKGIPENSNDRRVLGLAVIVAGIGTRQDSSVRASSKVFLVIYIKPLFPNCGSARNGAVSTNKKFKFPRKIPNIARNIAGIFVWQLAVLEQTPCATICFCFLTCMYVCMYVCMHECMYVCIYVCMYVCMHICMNVCMYACMYVCMHVCMCVYVCMYVCVCIYVCVCMHVCMCMYACMYVCMYACMCARSYACLLIR